MMVFCWRALPGTIFPPYLAMLLGLLTDVMSGGPLGFWALMALIAATAGARAPSLTDGQDLNRLWLVWGAVAGVVACLGWLLASLYFLRWIDCWPIAFGALASIALFPVVLHGLLWIRRGRLRPDEPRSIGGGREAARYGVSPPPFLAAGSPDAHSRKCLFGRMETDRLRP